MAAIESFVFLSYRHESREHSESVRQLADRLAAAGCPVQLDQFFKEENPGGPDEGWRTWSRDRATNSACVLIICSPGWFDSFLKKGARGKGLGSALEAAVFAQDIYTAGQINKRTRLVIVDDFDTTAIPLELQDWEVFRPFTEDEDFEQMVGWIRQRLVAAEAATKIVFVASSSPEVQATRVELQQFLEQQGWDVRPSSNSERDATADAWEIDLRDSVALIQIFDPRFPSATPGLQLEAARRLQLPCFVLRDSRVALTSEETDVPTAGDVAVVGSFADLDRRLDEERGRLGYVARPSSRKRSRASRWWSSLEPKWKTAMTVAGVAMLVSIGFTAINIAANKSTAGIETRHAREETARIWGRLQGIRGIPILYWAAPPYILAIEEAGELNRLAHATPWLRYPAAPLYRAGLLLEAGETAAARSALDEASRCRLCLLTPLADTDLTRTEWQLARRLLEAEIAYREGGSEAALRALGEGKDPYSSVLRRGIYNRPTSQRAVEELVAAINSAESPATPQVRSWVYDTAGAATLELATTPGEVQRALRYYKAATAAFPQNSTAWTNRGSLELELEQYDDAVRSLETVPLRGLTALIHGFALHARGLNARSRHDLAAAVEDFRLAMDQRLTFEEGDAYDRQRPREAYCPGGAPNLEIRERLEADALCSRAAVRYFLGDLPQALDDARRGYELCGTAECAVNLACARNESGLHSAAAEAFGWALKARERLPSDPSATERLLRRRGLALERAGRPEEAAADREAAERIGDTWRESFPCPTPLPGTGG